MEMREQTPDIEGKEAQDVTLPENEKSVENEVVTEETIMPANKDEVLQQLQEIADGDAEKITREKIESLKQLFYTFQRNEIAKLKDEFVANGGAPEEFKAEEDPREAQLKDIINAAKEKKGEYRKQIEAQQQANYDKKIEIIAKIAELSQDTDNVNKLFPQFRELQQEYRATGDVNENQTTEVWKKYKDAEEKFYDQLKVNKDLRDYDFKKNLEAKELLIEQAKRLTEDTDIVVAAKLLQELHAKWREIGPVAKDIREEIWAKFKDVSTIINKRHQEFFEQRKQKEQENEAAKTALCEAIEAIDIESVNTYALWEQHTKKILELQQQWKSVGFASKKSNNALFERFRAACDKFFEAKANFYKAIKENLEENLKRKTALCEKAEALSESSDWKKTTDALVKLQQEWKTIGTVPRKHSDAVWERFRAACDKFFERKKKQLSGTRHVEVENLKAKKAIIASLNAIAEGTAKEEVAKAVKEASAQWQQIGHVPFKDKDKIYEAYRTAVNTLYEKFDLSGASAEIDRFENSISEMAGDNDKLYRERERMVRAYEQRTAELATCENNLGFFTSSSKSGDTMLRDLQRRVAKLKESIATLEKKIRLIDEHIK